MRRLVLLLCICILIVVTIVIGTIGFYKKEGFDNPNIDINPFPKGPSISHSSGTIAPCQIYYTKNVEACDAGLYNSNILVYKKIKEDYEGRWASLTTADKLDYVSNSNIYDEMVHLQSLGLQNGCKLQFPDAWHSIAYSSNQLISVNNNAEPNHCYIGLNYLPGNNPKEKMQSLKSYITDNAITFHDISKTPSLFASSTSSSSSVFSDNQARIEFKDKSYNLLSNGIYCNLPEIDSPPANTNTYTFDRGGVIVLDGTLINSVESINQSNTVTTANMHMEQPTGYRSTDAKLVALIRAQFIYYLNETQPFTLTFVPNERINTLIHYVVTDPCKRYRSNRQKASTLTINNTIPLNHFAKTSDLIYGTPDMLNAKIDGFLNEINAFSKVRDAAAKKAQNCLHQYLDVLNQMSIKMQLTDYKNQLNDIENGLPANSEYTSGNYTLPVAPVLPPLQGQSEASAVQTALQNIQNIKLSLSKTKLLGANANVDWTTADVPNANALYRPYFTLDAFTNPTNFF